MLTLNLVLLNGRLLSTFFFFFCSALHSLFHPNVLIWITDFLILIRCQHWWPLTLSLPYSVPPSYQYPCWTLQCTVQSTWMQVQVHIPYSARLYKILLHKNFYNDSDKIWPWSSSSSWCQLQKENNKHVLKYFPAVLNCLACVHYPSIIFGALCLSSDHILYSCVLVYSCVLSCLFHDLCFSSVQWETMSRQPLSFTLGLKFNW